MILGANFGAALVTLRGVSDGLRFAITENWCCF